MICGGCGQGFETKSAKRRHKKQGCSHDPRDEIKSLDKDARRTAFECIAEGLTDGAYFAMAEEFGLEPTDLI